MNEQQLYKTYYPQNKNGSARAIVVAKGENGKAFGREQQQHLPEAAATTQAGHPGQLDATQKSHKSNQQSPKVTEHKNTNMNHGTHE